MQRHLVKRILKIKITPLYVMPTIDYEMEFNYES